MTEPARIDHDETGFRIATWRNVIVSVWCAGVTVPRLDALFARERIVRKTYPHGLVPFTVVADVPTDMLRVGERERQRAAEIAAEMGPITLAHPNVVLGSGFWSATVRGVMAAAYLFSKAKYPTKAFETIGEACTWVAPRMGSPAPDANDMRLAVESVVAGARRV